MLLVQLFHHWWILITRRFLLNWFEERFLVAFRVFHPEDWSTKTCLTPVLQNTSSLLFLHHVFYYYSLTKIHLTNVRKQSKWLQSTKLSYLIFNQATIGQECICSVEVYWKQVHLKHPGKVITQDDFCTLFFEAWSQSISLSSVMFGKSQSCYIYCWRKEKGNF